MRFKENEDDVQNYLWDNPSLQYTTQALKADGTWTLIDKGDVGTYEEIYKIYQGLKQNKVNCRMVNISRYTVDGKIIPKDILFYYVP